MTRLVLGLVAVSFVVAGLRNLPVSGASGGAAGVLLGAVFLGAWLLGRRSVKAEAVATAVASARAEAAAAAHSQAQAVSQVAVIVGGERGAAAVAAREFGQPAWIGPARLDVEQLADSDGLLSLADELREDEPEAVQP